MSKKNLAKYKEKLNEEISKLAASESIDLSKIKDLIAELHKIDNQYKYEFKDMYLQISNILFRMGISLPELDIDGFNKLAEKKEKGLGVAGKQTDIILEDDFDDTFRSLLDFLKKHNKTLKRHLFLKLGNANDETRILLLHDKYAKNPLCDRILSRFDDKCVEMNIEDLNSNTQLNKIRGKKFISILFLSPNTTSSHEIIDSINSLETYISPIELLTKINYNLDEGELYVANSDPDFLKTEIKSLIGIELINEDINSDIAKAIKLLFVENDCHTLEYKILKGGFSGSKVIQVQPYKGIGESCKYVVKISVKTDGKLKEEIDNFNSNVDTLDVDYIIKYRESDKYYAVMYSYASSNSKDISESFADYYSNNDIVSCGQVIPRLFDIPLFKAWEEETSPQLILPSEPYKAYLKEENIFSKICEILGHEDDELRNQYNKIINYKIKTNLKICHGDLHSENIFVDKSGDVFLIDFGHTKKGLHAVIDHVTLEASIKFRHIPPYIRIDELIDIEKDLLNVSTFEPNFDFKSIKRNDLKKPFHVINLIRCSSNKYIYSPIDKIDYFIALFLITMRQIQYDNLNQLYALESSKILAEHIISKIATMH
jgi:hypothetical protein